MINSQSNSQYNSSSDNCCDTENQNPHDLSGLIKGSDIIGLDIISLASGSKVETVTDILYDSQKHQVVGILVDKGGWFKEARIILINNIHAIGKDAVIIQNESVVKVAGDVPERVALIANSEKTLVKDNVITEQGLKLGSVSDIYLEFPGGKVWELEISQGLIGNMASGKKLVKTQDIVTIGENLIVSKFTEIDFEKQSKSQGLVGAGNFAKEKAADGLQKTKEISSEAAHKTLETSKNWAQISKEKLTETKNIVQAKAILAKDLIQEKVGPVIEKVKEKTLPVIEKTKSDFHSGQMQQNMQNTFDQTKSFVATKTGESRDFVLGKTEESKQKVAQASDKVQEEIQSKRKQSILGKRVGKITILSLEDEVLAEMGDLITYELIELCQKNQVLDKLFNNAI